MTAADLECPPNTVPGWLDEQGNPTSCVGDHPCPGFDAATCSVADGAETPAASASVEAVAQPAPAAPRDELAYTGPGDPLVGALLAVGALAMIGTGWRLTRRAARS